MTPVRELGSRTWQDLEGRVVTLVVPVGATEQHGPHLPVSTDSRIAAEIASRATQAADVDGDVLVAPTITYGASGEHESFPGTVSIGAAVMQQLIVEYGRSACGWAERIVFVNGHGGNATAIAAATQLLRVEGRDVAWWPCAFRGADAHAGDTETSVMLALDAGSVHLDLAEPGELAPVAELMPALRAGGVRAVSANGILGDPTAADAGRGERLLTDHVTALAAALATWTVAADGRLA